MRKAAWLCCVLLCVGLPTRAHAYEDQLTFGVGAGYGYAASDALPRHGAVLDLSTSAGLDRNLTVRGRGSYAIHPHDEPLHAFGLGGELLYMIDILQIVPYLGAGGGAVARMRGDADLELDTELHLALGVDYLVSRALAFEFEARPYLIVTELDRDPFYLAVVAAAVWFVGE